jgi:hypothetical protein
MGLMRISLIRSSRMMTRKEGLSPGRRHGSIAIQPNVDPGYILPQRGPEAHYPLALARLAPALPTMIVFTSHSSSCRAIGAAAYSAHELPDGAAHGKQLVAFHAPDNASDDGPHDLLCPCHADVRGLLHDETRFGLL